MSETATNIAEGFRTLRVFCGEVAKMLRTADSMMDDADWAPAGNKTVGRTSQSIEKPGEWLPHQFFRCYENEDYPDLVPFVSVIVSDREDEAVTGIDNALISGGYLEFEDGKEEASLEWAWACVSHAWMGEEDGSRKDDGTGYSVNPVEEWGQKYWKGLKTVKTFARPLDDITSAAALKEQVIQPLLDMLSQHSSPA